MTTPCFPEDKTLSCANINAFVEIFHNKAKYKLFLELREERAQSVLNTLQLHLHTSEDLPEAKNHVVKAIIRLCKRSSIYPDCLTLQGVKYSSVAVAAGHYGEIWKGELDGSKVCLKVIRAFENSDIKKLLRGYAKEAVLWGQLSHPNLLPFYGVYRLNDDTRRICLVSPWMENNLAQYLIRFPKAKRLLLLNDIAQGLSYLHSKDMVHGDLKGTNILVTSSGRACLCDFGLSSITDPDVLNWTSLQSTANAGGTVRWQAPELVEAEEEHVDVTRPCDIYSFACVCYELFTGNIPFYEKRRDPQVILAIIKGEKPSKPNLESRDSDSVSSRGLTENIWCMMQDCWATNPDERPDIWAILSQLPTKCFDPRKEHDWDRLSSERFRREMQRGFISSKNDSEQVAALLRDWDCGDYE